MSTKKKANQGALNAMNAGIDTAIRRSAGEFDGLFGCLPANTSFVLGDIVAYLRQYILDERGFTEAQVRKFLTQIPPKNGFHPLSEESEDEGLRVTVGVMNSILSAMKVRDGQVGFDGRRLNKNEAISLLFSGRDGLQRNIYVERQRASAKKGSNARSKKREQKEARWKEVGTSVRAKHQKWSNAQVAKAIASVTKDAANTIRQALPRLGLGKKADG